jgi:uncharacterized membrane protein
MPGACVNCERRLSPTARTDHKAPVQRLPFVDWARGFAVIAMVLWHTGDGWLRPALKAGEGFFFLRFIGGLAAPSFLMLAGVAAALAARPAPDPSRAWEKFRASLARGFEVWVLGYALRLQTWVVDAAAIQHLGTYRAWLPLLLGYGCLVLAARTHTKQPRHALWLFALGVGLVVAALLQVEDVAPGRLLRLLQVDVLQAIGASLMLLALLERAFGLLQKPVWLLLCGLAIALATEPIAAQLPGALPIPIAAYFGRFPAGAGAPNPALFPLFPWLAYALLGAAFGACLRLYPERAERTVVLGLLGGALLAMGTSEAHRFVRVVLRDVPLVVPLMRTGFRVGIVLVLMGIGYAFPRGRGAATVLDFGRASLRIYWIHLLFAYGICARPVHAKLHYASWLGLVLALLIAMWAVSRVGTGGKRAPVRA